MPFTTCQAYKKEVLPAYEYPRPIIKWPIQKVGSIIPASRRISFVSQDVEKQSPKYQEQQVFGDFFLGPRFFSQNL